MAATINLRGVDLYHGDRVTSFKRAADFGICGVIHQATTGATGRDSRYANRAPPARTAGVHGGAYHRATAANASRQADKFLKTAQPADKPLVGLDFEETPGNRMARGQAREFLRASPRSLD